MHLLDLAQFAATALACYTLTSVATRRRREQLRRERRERRIAAEKMQEAAYRSTLRVLLRALEVRP